MRPSFPRSYRGSPLLIFLPMLLISGQLFANTLFGPPSDIPISGFYSSLIALGDLNNDGNLDIVVGSAFGASDGNGVFTDRKSTRLNSSHQIISYAVFCLKKKNRRTKPRHHR